MIKKYIQKIGIVISFTLLLGVSGTALPAHATALTARAPVIVAASGCNQDCEKLYTKYLNPFVKLLSAVVGVFVVLMVIMGGVQYSAAGSDPQKVAEARKKITNALLGLAAYIFLLTFLNWLVPGGIV